VVELADFCFIVFSEQLVNNSILLEWYHEDRAFACVLHSSQIIFELIKHLHEIKLTLY